MDGGTGRDDLYGDDGNDIIYLDGDSSGLSIITGGGVTFIGSATGGLGSDRFVVRQIGTTSLTNVITDFDINNPNEKVDLSQLGIYSINELNFFQWTIPTTNIPVVLIGLNTGGQLCSLAGFTNEQITPAIFIFATSGSTGSNDPATSGVTQTGNQLTGDAGGNRLVGDAGAQIMDGRTGDDTYIVNNTGDIVNELPGGGYDTVESSITYTLADNVEQLILTGISAINGTGNNDINRLVGNSGNNVLDGKGGSDDLLGGIGDDTYLVDVGTDRITEKTNEGIDTVLSSVSYLLSNNLENLTLTGLAAINATGNELNNTLLGNAASNNLDGSLGADGMAGGAGNDSYNVDNNADVVNENAGEGFDIVYSSAASYTLSTNIEQLVLSGTAAINGTGSADNNTLYGNAANNLLDGGLGADTMAGLLGDDTYYVENTGDVVTELTGQGLDSVYSTISYTLGADVENLVLRNIAGTINAYGNALDNNLRGNNANNILDGGAGVDTMAGLLGDDTYYVENAGDVVTELAGQGLDTIYSTISYTLGADVEQLVLRQIAGNVNGYGNALSNNLRGNNANNILDGGVGADTMAGGLGDDTYYVENAGDVVTEFAGQGLDTVYSTLSYTLGADVENLVLRNIAGAINGTGNALNNNLRGNNANNVLDGGAGADTLTGGLGNDTYNLTETIAATDTLRIATGDSLGVANHDRVNDFQRGMSSGSTLGVDRLDLDTTTIAANAVVNGIDAGNILSHSVTNGIISFDDAQSYAAPMTIGSGDLINVINYLRANVTGGNTVAFIDDTNHTYVFQDGGATDTFVELVGVTATSVNTTGLGVNSVWII